MSNPASFGLFLSGGSSNVNPALSTGGAISSKQVFSMTATHNVGKPPITALEVIEAVGLPAATDITLSFSGNMLTASYAGNTASVAPGAAGLYTLSFASNRYINVRITDAALIGSTVASTVVQFSYAKNALFTDVSSDQATVGASELRYVYFKNLSAVAVTNVRIFLEQSAGGDQLLVGLTTADLKAYTALTDSLPLGPIPAGGAAGFYVQRIVPENITRGSSENIAQIKYYVSVP
ncbi:hypothetical protein QEL91_002033 [Pseudomonas putida]|nr:hypothetical protein [Pseudomonas putida]